MKKPLSKELKVACEIYKYQKKKRKIWFNKLAKNLKDEMTQKEVYDCVNTLFDWSIIKADYGPAEKGREGRLYYISSEAKPTIKDLYKHWWR